MRIDRAFRDVSPHPPGGKRNLAARGGKTKPRSRGWELLRGARDLVAKGWCQGADARDAEGVEVDAWAGTAVCWSLLGAVVATLEREAATTGEIPLDELSAALYALANVIDSDSLVAWNDNPQRSRLEVLSVLDAASAGYEAPPVLHAGTN